MMQCVSQALSLSSRKPIGGKAQYGDSMASLLQLPHFDGDVLKKLKRGKVNTLKGARQPVNIHVRGNWGFWTLDKIMGSFGLLS